jgi:hypothetical protein
MQLRTIVAILTLTFPTALFAQSPAPWNVVQQDPAPDVAARLNQLENETQALRAEVQRLQSQAVRLPAVEATPTALASAPAPEAAPVTPVAAPQAGPPEDYFTLDELRGEMKKFSWKKGDFTITPYGYLWGNMVYSTERTYPNSASYTLWVLSPKTSDAESECIVDVRNTRLGFDVGGPQIPFFNCAQSGGKVEIDFQNYALNATAGENKSTVMLRHAYFDVKNDDFRLLVGQTWDVISPLYPGMLLYSVGWDGGNIGYRRMQFRGERFLAFSDTSLVTSQLALCPQVFSDNLVTANTTAGTITGEPTGWPVIEGRVAWTIGQRAPGCLPITVGLSGHVGEQEFDTSLMGNNNHRRTWSGNLDVRVPLTERLGVQGECQIGENLGTFLGGIGQGIDPTTLTTIRDAGGWFEIWYDWTPCLHSHVGYSVDQPVETDVHAASGRTYNQFYFGNLVYDFTKSFIAGLEVSSWRTLYKNQLPGDSVRCELVAKYGF